MEWVLSDLKEFPGACDDIYLFTIKYSNPQLQIKFILVNISEPTYIAIQFIQGASQVLTMFV